MRYKLILEYDGTPFVGWQTQNNGISVQEILEAAVATCTRESVTVHGTGRTDAGVHAVDYVAHIELSKKIKPEDLRASLNALVRPHPISVKSVEPAGDDFHARFSAKQRSYIYKIQNTRYPPALDKNRVWHYYVPKILDAEKMNAAAQILVGKHDFSTFRDSACQAKSPVKTLDEIRVWRAGDMVFVTVAARSFLHHQVRNIVGSLVNVGCGKWSVKDFERAFKACDRRMGGITAPAEGLYFLSAKY